MEAKDDQYMLGSEYQYDERKQSIPCLGILQELSRMVGGSCVSLPQIEQVLKVVSKGPNCSFRATSNAGGSIGCESDRQSAGRLLNCIATDYTLA
jgi:hypothetical protein